MDPRLSIHNLHQESLEAFLAGDPHLRRLRGLPLVWEDPLLQQLPADAPGIYTLGGARQVGKSTLLKQWMKSLLERGVSPTAVTYLTAEIADDHHVLHRWIQDAVGADVGGGPRFVIVDEVTYVERWDRAVKFLADAGILADTVLVLTGSDLGLLREMRTYLPGRRGRSSTVDFHLHPLTWIQTCELTGELHADERTALESTSAWDPRALSRDGWARCWHSLDAFLRHGGFLTALNDVSRVGAVERSTLSIYSDWIRGDMLKRGKSEHLLREVLQAVTDRLGSHYSWNALSRDLSIDHPSTVADYVQLLERMDALFIQAALKDRGLTAAPKKARKVVPTDPFILHAIESWLRPSTDPSAEVVERRLSDPSATAALIEATTVAHARRHFPTFYMKQTSGEIDIAVVVGRRVYPIEVKWRRQLRPGELRLVTRARHGVATARVESVRRVDGLPIVPLPRALALLGRGTWPPSEADRS